MHKIHKYALLLVFPSLLAGCSGVDHASYPFKTSGQNTALGAWEFVQTKMNSNIMPLYQIQDVQPKNMLFVGKKHGCHVFAAQNGKPVAERLDAETASGTVTLSNGPMIPGNTSVTYGGDSGKMRLQSGSPVMFGGNILRRLPINSASNALRYIENTYSVSPKDARRVLSVCIDGKS
ncbi:hypothetical protein [Acidithiobacillus thiooxidans]|uniref:hypothetical protein n=1 Tax=Acidithiobacillus thiooxidans TaxID=930 RepID=UPI0004E18C56|nr:hypothetical protein [Acidithiobacillus thiooxidans]